MDAHHVLATLCLLERLSHVAHALQGMLKGPISPKTLPHLRTLAGVLCLGACEAAENLADGLGTEAASARQGGPSL